MVRKWTIPLFMVCLLAAWPVRVFAENAAVAAQVNAEAAAPAVQVNAEAPAQEVKAEPEATPAVMEMDMSKAGLVTLDFRDADIKNVLKVLAYKSGVNIIAGPEVVGLVNIQLKDVPWQKALDVILSTYGYNYEQKGTILMVTTTDNLKKRREDAKVLSDQEPVSTKTFILNFSKAEDVVKTLDKMKTGRGSINFDQRTNAIIVHDVDSNIAIFEEVIKKLDAVTPQILIEARIIETALNSQEVLGLQWPTSFGASATFPVQTHTFPWGTGMNNGTKFAPATQYANPTTIGDKTALSDTKSVMTYGTLSLSQLSLTLDALQSRTNTNVLSNPRIVTLDNEPAKIQVGNKYPLPKYTYSDTQDKLIISGWEYIEYGLTFKVTPHINGKGVVTLDIEPEIVDSSATVAFNFGGGTATNVPVLTMESAKTNVMIRDGETLVIAGLIRDKKTKITSKVPLLGDIPFFGAPFRHKDDTVIKTELLIFLTPHIITPSLDMTNMGADKK
ncbi:MAG: type IV pilus secretin PilQ [Candidatus Omnitrophica bacterium]|nr:type IV pilus secretin PilQ [Candidatus Omnitrophota bacterium]